MKVHELKTWPAEFYAVLTGEKRFEIRRDDREFKHGDLVVLREFVPDDPEALAGAAKVLGLSGGAANIVKPGYTGRFDGPFMIQYVERSKCLPEGWCGFGLLRMSCDRT